MYPMFIPTRDRTNIYIISNIDKSRNILRWDSIREEMFISKYVKVNYNPMFYKL